MTLKINAELSNLLQNLSNAISGREGVDTIRLDNEEYLNGVKKAVPEIEKSLEEVKKYLQDK